MSSELASASQERRSRRRNGQRNLESIPRQSQSIEHTSQIPIPTAVWVVIAFTIPVNHALPSVGRALYFIAIGVAIGVSVLLRYISRPLYPGVWVFAGYAAFVSAVSSLRIEQVADNAFVGMQLLLLLGFAPFVLTQHAAADERFATRVGVAFMAGQTFSSAVAFAQQFGFTVLQSGNAVSGRTRGLADHQNSLGIMACVALLISLNLLLTQKSFRGFSLATLAINILGLFASGSLTAMVAFAAGSCVLLASMRDRFGKFVAWAIPFTGALWFIGSKFDVFDYLPSVAYRYRQVTVAEDSMTSLEVRAESYRYAWARILEDPINGVGLNIKWSGTFNGITMVHNAFLRAWYQGGIFLAVAFGLIAIAITIAIGQAVLKKDCAIEASVLTAVLVFSTSVPLLEQREFWLPVLVAWASISASHLKGSAFDNRSKSHQFLRRTSEVVRR